MVLVRILIYKNPFPDTYSTLAIKTVMVGCLPFPNQQKSLLDALLQQLLLYYLVTKPKRKSEGIQSFYQFGKFSLITFLHSR